jgi:large subunit ribosomal protein L29
MKKHEIAAMGKQELIEKIDELQNRLADINFYKAIELPQNPMVFRNSRREIARMKTQLRKMELQESSKA